MVLNEFTSGVNTNFSTELNENNYELLKQMNRYSNNLESNTFTNYTGTLYVLSTTEALDFRGASGVYYTDDVGATWTQRSTESVGTTIYRNNSFPNSIITSSHYTIDGGVTWTAFTAFTTYTPAAYSITDDGGSIYVLATDGTHAVIYKSENDGASWTLKYTSAGQNTGAYETVSIQSPVDGVVHYAFQTAGGADEDATTALTFDDFSTTEFVRNSTDGYARRNISIYIDEYNYAFDSQVETQNGGYAIKWRADKTNGISINSTSSTYAYDNGDDKHNIICFTPERLIIAYGDEDGNTDMGSISRYYDGTEVFTQTTPAYGMSIVRAPLGNTDGHYASYLSINQDENIKGVSLNKEIRKVLIAQNLIPSW